MEEKCPALHPLVLAMLILMFVTFAGAVGVVAFVVWKNQRAADEEEARQETEFFANAEKARSRNATRARTTSMNYRRV